MEDKVDVHNFEHNYKVRQEVIAKDTSIPARSRDLLAEFLRDCELGKTVLHKQKKKISVGTLLKYLIYLSQAARWLKKPLDEVELFDMEQFILGLERDEYRRRDGLPFRTATKVHFKRSIRKFYKWLLGDNKEHPKLVDWIDTWQKLPEIPALSREEIEQLVDGCSKIRDRTIVMVLFDGGTRISEFLNLRRKDLIDGGEYHKIRIRYSKTKSRTISLPLASDVLSRWLKHHPKLVDSESLLFPYRYQTVKKMLSRLGKQCLSKKVTPQLLRHSSATYYCTRINWAQLCYRFGWELDSPMPRRYIDRQGIQDEEAMKTVQTEEVSKDREQAKQLREDLAHIRTQHDELLEKHKIVMETFAPLLEDPKRLEQLTNLMKKLGQRRTKAAA